ncbi:uncharacterized protein LOC142624256 [Castanea sativa]|uniref:uncharacterized protein LOC142624256 n=1 Tax=Castanea sativa TaxID=21020 RepID=UPI003F64C60F
MKLNPSKCVFGVASGKFLGFMVSQRGIEANPEKVQAILDMTSPKTVKEVQKLTRRIATLNSQALQGAESRYPRTEKIAFALIVASRKLRPYFEANPIVMMTNQPIKKFMNKPEAVGRMVQWAIELSQFDIEYHPRIAIKAQVLVDLIAEFTLLEDDNSNN